jgi:predicted helicase
MIAAYSRHLAGDGEPTRDTKQISWSRRLLGRLKQGQALVHDGAAYRVAMYRPFHRQFTYFSADLNEDRRRLPVLFPLSSLTNQGFLLTGVASHYEFAVIAADAIPDLHLLDTGQFFPRWTYEPVAEEGTLGFDFGDDELIDGYRRVDNITDWSLTTFRKTYGKHISKDDVFFYAYGLLHSPEYRETYSSDVKKVLPRLPLVTDARPFITAGKTLFNLHLTYEAAQPYSLTGLDVAASGDPFEFFRVEKMAWARVRQDGKLVNDRTTIKYNSRVELAGIPAEALRYMLGPRSALDWLIDRYQVRTDKDSSIVNDPNDWSREFGNPRYILDLVARVVTVSVETMKIVDSLPPIDIIK